MSSEFKVAISSDQHEDPNITFNGNIPSLEFEDAESNDPSSLSIFLQKYAKGAELGSGCYGTAILCCELGTNTMYAAKIIRKDRMTTGSDFGREVKVLSDLPPHRNIIALKDALEDTNNYYLVTEYCGGGMLEKRLEKHGHYMEEDASRLVRSIVEGLKVITAKNVI